jgi:hypothetical protein
MRVLLTAPGRRAAAYLASAAALNLPLVLCHPGRPLAELPLLRSLAVGLVLFLAPGIPWTSVLWRVCFKNDYSQPRLKWLWTVAASLLGLLAVLVVIRLTGWPLGGSTAWNGVWLLTNAGVLLNIVLGGPPAWGALPRDLAGWLGVPLFLAAYAAFFIGADRVPKMEDQDFDVLGCGYGLLARFEPLLVSDHDTVYQFAHPPLAHFITAASFLYFDRLDYLKYYDAASQRALAARQGRPFAPFDGTVDGLSGGHKGGHRVVGVVGDQYIIDPPLETGSRSIPVWLLENGVLAQYYNHDPQKLVTRTPHIFLAALTVALLGCWIARMTGRWSLAVLVPLAYASSPEVWVRSSYGGHFAAANFAVLALLMAVEQLEAAPSRAAWLDCLLAGGLAALADHKLMLLPLAVVLWVSCRVGRRAPTRSVGRRVPPRNGQPMSGGTRFARPTLLIFARPTLPYLAGALLHPVVLGFAAGAALFWLWGFSVNGAEFWLDHVQTHFIRRILHDNLLNYSGYPGVAALWLEFWRHTGYLLLPLGLAALLLCGLPRFRGAAVAAGSAPARTPALWLLWTLLTAAAFSLVDWRQTKHLMPLLIPLYLAPACWAAGGKRQLALVLLLMAGLTAWNLVTVWRLAHDFAALSITPGW